MKNKNTPQMRQQQIPKYKNKMQAKAIKLATQSEKLFPKERQVYPVWHCLNFASSFSSAITLGCQHKRSQRMRARPEVEEVERRESGFNLRTKNKQV
jgi:hypothetical protein